MDSRESAAGSPHPYHQQQQQQPPPQQMMMLPPPPNNSYNPNIPSPTTTTTNNFMMGPNSITNSANTLNPHRFNFNPTTKPSDSVNLQYGVGEGSSESGMMMRPGGSGGPGGPGGFTIEPARKKRGRPRKYAEGTGGGPATSSSNISLGLSPTPVTPISTTVPAPVHGDSSGAVGDATPLSSEPSAASKKGRGRPPGSGKKQLDALGAAGVGFTPHVIQVKAGEDISSKIMAFSLQGPRTVCILSANGAIGNVTLRQSGGNVTYEGRFEIISLSGSFAPAESNDGRSRTGGLSVSLAGSDGRVLGGGVSGLLVAATPVQVVVGSFIADGKKPKSGNSAAAAPTNMLNFGAPVPGVSPPSEGPSNESSDESGGSSPLNRGPGGPYSNASQPLQNSGIYANMGWATSNMLPH